MDKPAPDAARRIPLRRLSALLLFALPSLACQPTPDGRPPAQGYLFQRGTHQGFYTGDGSLRRLLRDDDGDGVADMSVLFHPNGKPSRIEADTDADGVVDTWEVYTARGDLERKGSSESGNAWPERWDILDRDGSVRRREFDANGDRGPERVETFLGGALVSVTLDSDGNGAPDRWQSWRDGQLQTEEFDTDADGRPNSRLRYRADGTPGALERITPPR